MTLLQILALVCFLCAAVLAFVGPRVARANDGWAVLVALGLALWLLSETHAVS